MPRRGRGGGPWWLLEQYTVWSMVLSGEHNRTERLSSEQNPAQSQDRHNISLVNLNLLVIILFGNLWCYDGLIWLPYQTQTEEKLSVVHHHEVKMFHSSWDWYTWAQMFSAAVSIPKVFLVAKLRTGVCWLQQFCWIEVNPAATDPAPDLSQGQSSSQLYGWIFFKKILIFPHFCDNALFQTSLYFLIFATIWSPKLQ